MATDPPARDADRAATLLVRPAACELRRSLRPVAWCALEEIAHHAEVAEGRLRARTSTRLLAKDLHLDVATVIRAVRALRDRGLLHHVQPTGSEGRFGLSVYELADLDGLEVVPPCTAAPRTGKARTAGADGGQAPSQPSLGLDW